MNEKRAIAGAILDKSRTAVTTQRGAQHGDAESSFEAIGEMWMAYLNAAAVRRFGMKLIGLTINAQDVALMMGHVKEMRVVYGDDTEPDHYADHAGYVALAGSFRVPASAVAPAQSAAPAAPEQPVIPPFLHRKLEELDMSDEMPAAGIIVHESEEPPEGYELRYAIKGDHTRRIAMPVAE